MCQRTVEAYQNEVASGTGQARDLYLYNILLYLYLLFEV